MASLGEVSDYVRKLFQCGPGGPDDCLNTNILGGTGAFNGMHGSSVDGMFGGLGYDPIEPGVTIFVDTVFFNSVLDGRIVSTVEFETKSTTTLQGVNIFLTVAPGSTARAAKNFDLIADTDGNPGFQPTDDHVFVTLTYDSNGLVELFVPFVTTATHFLFEAEPYFDNTANMFLGPRLLEFDAVTAAPQLTAAVSRKTHGASGDFDLPLVLDPAGSGTVEPRANGPTTVVFAFSEDVVAADGAISANEFTITNANFSSASIAGNTITLNLTGALDQSVVTIALNGINDITGNPLTGDNNVEIRALAGDATQDKRVGRPDSEAVRAHARQPLDQMNYLFDLNLDGRIGKPDDRVVQMNNHHSVP